MAKAPPDIPDYEMLRPIGRGAFGEVWLARAVTGQYRAVKVLRCDELPHRRAFQREFDGVVRYEPVSRSQPNLVHVLHVGRAADGQSFWYVMELADDENAGDGDPATDGALRKVFAGGAPPTAHYPTRQPLDTYKPRTLRSVLRARGRVSIEECVSTALGIAEAAVYLHARDLVHRDIKPSNVIFVNGVAKLADIGLVTTSEEPPSFVGTAGYIPPDGPGTPAADIYALGKVLYEMATGRAVQDFPRLPEDFTTVPNRRVLVDLNEIIIRAAENDPRRRYARMEDLRSDLMLLGAGRSARRWRRLERWLKVTLRMAAVVAGVAFVSTGLGVWANRERLRAQAAERELSTRFVEQQLFLARATRLTGVPGQRTRALSIIYEAARKTNSLALRNEAVAALGLPDISHSRTIPGGLVVFDNLVRRYATNDADGNIFVRSVEDDRVLARLSTGGVSASAPAPAGLAALDFSALGDYLCATYSNRLFLVWPLAISPPGTDRPTRSPTGNRPEPALPRRIALTCEPRGLYMVPGGHLAAIPNDSGALHIFDLEACRQVRVIEGSFTNSIAFSSDGARFASIGKGSFAVRDLVTGVEQQSFTNRITGFENLVWHPDGRQIVTTSGERDLRLWNLETGSQSGVLRGHEAEVIDAAYDSSAQWLLSASWDNHTVLWNVARQKAVLRMAGSGNGMRFSADARRIAWHRWDDRQWEIFDMTPPSEVAWLEQHPRQEAPTGLRSLWGAVFLDADVLAGEGNAGFSVWLPPTSYAQALAPTGMERPLFAVPGRSLYSSGENGVRRWPIIVDPVQGEIHVGPPERLSPAKLGATREFSVSNDGLRIAFLTASRHLFLLVEKAPSGCRELNTGGVRAVAFAPAGGFVAASLMDGGIRIWDVGTGTITTNLPCPPAWTCKVSPDGRWLSAGTPESFLIWRVADWRLVHQIRRTAVSVAAQAWSPDGEVFLAHDVDSTIRMFRSATWEELASLPAPEMLREICPSPDGTRLALAGEKSGIELWDLRRLRRRLGELGLDWTGPPILAAQEPPPPKRWNLQVDLGPD
ncbi:MAG TPA: protein kinase [Verrucomicrobiae bacterium]